jgi:hypothetical protein
VPFTAWFGLAATAVMCANIEAYADNNNTVSAYELHAGHVDGKNVVVCDVCFYFVSCPLLLTPSAVEDQQQEQQQQQQQQHYCQSTVTQTFAPFCSYTCLLTTPRSFLRVRLVC